MHPANIHVKHDILRAPWTCPDNGATVRAMLLEIRKMRQARKMTQEALAEALGTTQGMVSRYERGLAPLEWPRIVEIARALGCPVAALLPADAFGSVDPRLLFELNQLPPERQALVRQTILAMLSAPESPARASRAAPLSLPAPSESDEG